MSNKDDFNRRIAAIQRKRPAPRPEPSEHSSRSHATMASSPRRARSTIFGLDAWSVVKTVLAGGAIIWIQWSAHRSVERADQQTTAAVEAFGGRIVQSDEPRAPKPAPRGAISLTSPEGMTAIRME